MSTIRSMPTEQQVEHRRATRPTRPPFDVAAHDNMRCQCLHRRATHGQRDRAGTRVDGIGNGACGWCDCGAFDEAAAQWQDGTA